MAPWRWRAKDGLSSTLLYEPGNWGDLLKLGWLVETARWLETHAGGPLPYLDPFAGAPVYPLAPGTRKRLAALEAPAWEAAGSEEHGAGTSAVVAPLLEALAPFRARGLWPSAAAILQTGGAALGAQADRLAPADQVVVGESDPERRAALAESESFTILPTGGYAALADPLPGLAGRPEQREGKGEGTDAGGNQNSPTGGGGEAFGAPSTGGARWGLVLVDPYDWLAEWRTQAAALWSLATRSPVLLYLYNRAARGKERLRDYRDFRNALADARPEGASFLGRVASDGFLPQAHHELHLLLPPRMAALPSRDDLGARLYALTTVIAQAIANAAAFEAV